MTNPDKKLTRNRLLQVYLSLIMVTSLGLTGCTSILSPIDTIPANRVPVEFLAPPRANDESIDFALLGQEKPEAYILDEGDVLGVYIRDVLGDETTAPPVNFPDPESDLNPSIGYPTPVREDGTISLPLVDPIAVRGLTVPQAEELVKRTYEQEELLVNPRIIVTLMRKRTYRVFVIRQDYGDFNQGNQQFQLSRSAVTSRSDETSRGFVLQLPAYENDVINALTRTGGLPGLNSKTNIKILRASRNSAERQRRLESAFRLGENQFPQGMFEETFDSDDADVVTIPLRLKPGQTPRFRPEDVVLNDGDILYVESRESEVYYTSGLLRAGEWNLPRDYDLDVLGAVSIAGTSVATGQQGGGVGLQAAAGSSVPPTQLVILRKLPNRNQIAIEVDLTTAINDPKSRLLIAPGDTLILRYRPQEELINFASGTFFTFGIRELFRR